MIRPGEQPERVEVFGAENRQQRRDYLEADAMLFCLPDFPDFGKVFSEWLKKSLSLATVYELFFVTFFEPKILPRFHFLSSIQAVESFHRIVYGGKYMAQEDFDKLANQIKESLPAEITGELRVSMKNRVGHGNEPSLRKRLTKTLQTLEPDTLGMFTGNIKRFAERIVNTRNYLTHNDESGKGDATPENELRPASRKMLILCRLLLLREMGVAEAVILTAIRRNPNLRSDLVWDVTHDGK